VCQLLLPGQKEEDGNFNVIRKYYGVEGFPNEWAAPGSITRLNGVLTPFGPLHMELIVDNDGQNTQLKLKKMEGSKPDKIVLHLSGLTGKDYVRDLPVDKDIDITIPLAKNSRQF
jgi:hypothetical protein